ncbi:unnamed protein product [Diamesa serratosioi]
MPFGRRSPLEALVITPASHLACKYNQFRARRREAQSRRVTERELSNLHNKIGWERKNQQKAMIIFKLSKRIELQTLL